MNENEIIQSYLEGKSILQLSKESDIPYCRIQKILKKNNITIRGGRHKKTLSDSDLECFRLEFQNGVSLDDLSEKYHMDKTTLRRIAEENNIKRKNNNKVNKRIKSDYFSIIDSHEKAYWLGLLFTDGCIDHPPKGQTRIRLSLQARDEHILESYKEYLGLDSKIITDCHRQNSVMKNVEFVDDQIGYDLARHGIIQNKTYLCKNIDFDSIPKEFIPSFLLGLFDGDGGITFNNNKINDVTLNFTSYYQSTVEDFRNQIDELIEKETHNKSFFTSAWHVQWRGRTQVLKILDILYENSPIFLNRKKEKYFLLKNSISQDIV